MASEVKLPELGEGIEGAQVLSVLVSPGDTVRKDQTIIEVETEKATAEVPTEVSGVVVEVKVKKGDQITVGQVLVTLNLSEAPDAEAPVAKVEAKEPPAPKTPVSKSEPAAPAPPKPAAEPVVETPPEPGSKPETIVYFEEDVQAKPAQANFGAAAAPSIRRLARELGVPIEQVNGTGPGGRVSESDIKTYARSLINQGGLGAPAPTSASAPVEPTAAPSHPPLPDFSQWGDVERMPLSMVRKATAKAVRTAWSTIPMVTQFDRADITELDAFRREYSKKSDTKLTVTAIAVKVLASALKAFPQFNASLDLAQEEVIYKSYVHVGVAVDTDRGLLVPVLRDVDQKNVRDIADELGAAAQRARDGKTSLEELRGGTFTVSNLGGLGTTYFSPIVNWPQVAILGLGRATVEAVFQDGQFVPRSLLPLAVTYDHRIIDGADAARFLRWVARAMEQPILLAVEG